MDKRGVDERQLLWLFYLVVSVLILLSAISFVNNAVRQTGLDGEYYARDLAYTLDLIYAANDDVEYIYNIEGSEFDFFVGKFDDKHKVIVAKTLDSKGFGVGSKSYDYNSLDEFGLFNRPGQLKITNKDYRIAINDVVSSLKMTAGSYISKAVSSDEYGSYRWKIDAIKEDKIIVRKEYVAVSNMQDTENILRDIDRTTKNYDEIITKMAVKYTVDANIIRAMIFRESSGNPEKENAVSGAVGLMQILPSTSLGLKTGRTYFTDEELLQEKELLKQPETNIEVGTQYIKQLFNSFTYEEIALAAYNWGPTNIRNNCEDTFHSCKNIPSETSTYVKLVVRYRNLMDIRDGKFIAGREGEAREIMIGSLEELDDDQHARLISITTSGSTTFASVEVT